MTGSARLDELRRLVRKRHVLETAIEIERELAARRLDAKLEARGYPVRRRQRGPRQRAELAGQVIMRRGPEQWGDRVRAYVR